MKKHVFKNKLSNAIEPAAPASVWGKAVPCKGGKTTNGTIVENTKKEDK